MKKILKVFKSSKSEKASVSTSTTSPAAATPSATASTTPATTTSSAPATGPEKNTAAMAADKVDTATYLKAIGHRRTVYPLSDKVSVSDDRIVEVVQEVLKVSPSSYNSQPMRVAIMLGEHHKKFWQIVKDKALPLLAGAGEEVVKTMSQRFEMFQAAYGSITFWEDAETIKEWQGNHQSVAGMFPQWGEHANGMLQVQVWTAIELEGLGANLQHMNSFPPVEAEIKKVFDIPESWSLRAHLNIGSETTPHPENPEKKPFSETLKVFKA
ncbi:uncharacterized protein PV09_07068 [Verruconis gallopava]|uniref:Nitroreductase domain-containing protein n=1 Tax=Verruconis gallopava TaxID=253628 RepID=A0A0D1XHA2_9PEZI|nr:uncharacterized protein PV09_07068 [Verruconis gallopava]KIW01596.1 hypothetical protein PV09_07068 [Verruconis gallopava]